MASFPFLPPYIQRKNFLAFLYFVGWKDHQLGHIGIGQNENQINGTRRLFLVFLFSIFFSLSFCWLLSIDIIPGALLW